jgi:hypothetical protein
MNLKLTELLHHIKTEKKDGMVNIDDWRFPDVGHLLDMGFDFEDDFHLSTPKEPKITIYQKKEVNEKNEKVPFFFVQEENQTLKKFERFNDVIDYFDKYSQPEIDDKN